MKILFTGDYTSDYNRTNILLKGLKSIPEIEVLEYPIASKKKWNKKEFQGLETTADVIFLPSFTHNSVPFIRKKTKKPIIFDPLISRYLTKVFDYKLVWKYSPRGLKNFLKDLRAFRASDIIIADTQAHKEYFINAFKIVPEKIQVLPIGVNTSDFAAVNLPELDPTKFKIGFYGGFIPLQGVKNIIQAAKILKDNTDLSFELIGTGFEYEEIKNQVKQWGLQNISFLGWVQYENLAAIISQWDICLGIFGTTIKSNLVIPNKIYHYAAMGKAIITKQSPAITEIFCNNNSIVLCSERPEDIADKIIYLFNHSRERNSIGESAKMLISENYNQDKIAEKFVRILKTSFR
jgi:glycosyltransferase involved in cell wall biosynthesis